MGDHWTDRLSEYLDGELAERERRELDRHLEGCGECRAALAGLESVVAEARSLGQAAPPEDLWPAIAARIEPRQPRPSRRGLLAHWLGREVTLSLPQAAAAGLALIVISAATVWMVGRAPMPVTRGPSVTDRRPDPGGDGPPAPSPIPAAPEARRTAARPPAPEPAGAAGETRPVAVEAALADPTYDAAIAGLQRILEQERARLDPSTVQVLERNLRIVDRALEEARRAVAADPSSFYLRHHLARVMKRKVDLLKLATSMARESG
jgi:hypothetical protein